MYTLFCKYRYLLYFIKSRPPRFSGRSPPRPSTTEMEQETVSGSAELRAEAASYRCSACHGDEDWGLGHPTRGRAKSRSLSAAPALASTREFRYQASSGPAWALRHARGGRSCCHSSQRAPPATVPARCARLRRVGGARLPSAALGGPDGLRQCRPQSHERHPGSWEELPEPALPQMQGARWTAPSPAGQWAASSQQKLPCRVVLSSRFGVPGTAGGASPGGRPWPKGR